MTADPGPHTNKPPLHRYQALCCDFDGTLAHDSVVAPEMVTALERVAASGRRVLLVTGRELDDLRRVFEPIRVVAENGALLYTPGTAEERRLGAGPASLLLHLRQHDYSSWIESEIKDPALSAEVRQVEDMVADPTQSRRAVRGAVERLYTLPA